MTRTKQREADSSVPTVNDLLEQRSRLLGWLARLEEVDDAESRRVVERVRADYQQRLQGVVESLSVHLESLRAELDAARERGSAAEERLAEADDALRETRLRHRIGEIDEEAWEARRGDLEAAVSAAAGEREETAAEAARLADVLAQIESGVLTPALAAEEERPPAPEPVPEPRPEPEPEPESEPILAVESLEVELAMEVPPAPAVPDEEGGSEGDEDLAFLEELDRAIAASAELTDPEPREEEGEEEAEVDTRPAKGMKCLECGYTNDATAWYCGVCGVELP